MRIALGVMCGVAEIVHLFVLNSGVCYIKDLYI